MSVQRTARSMDEFRAMLEADLVGIRAAIEGAIGKTIEASVPIVQKHVPVAFGELRDSIHAEETAVVADAPHAAPAETGSMPHMPPVEPLQEWAALKGFDDPESAGWAIAIKISREGTKPTWYMRGSLPEIRDELERNIRQALSGDPTSSVSSAAAKRAAIGAATGSTASVAAKFGVSASTVRRIRAEAKSGKVRSDSRIRIK